MMKMICYDVKIIKPWISMKKRTERAENYYIYFQKSPLCPCVYN